MKKNVKRNLELTFENLATWERMVFKLKERYPSMLWNEAESRYFINEQIEVFPTSPFFSVVVVGPTINDSCSFFYTEEKLFKKIDDYIKMNPKLKSKPTASTSIAESIDSFYKTADLWAGLVLELQYKYSDFKMDAKGSIFRLGKDLTVLFELRYNRITIFSTDLGQTVHTYKTKKGIIGHIEKVLVQARHQREKLGYPRKSKKSLERGRSCAALR